MLMVVALGSILLFVFSIPYWLPEIVIRMRQWIFRKVNGVEGVSIPGKEIGIESFQTVYSSPHANGRSRGARLSNLFWYWLSPGAEIHQEHVEPGPMYDELAQVTKGILAVPASKVESMIEDEACLLFSEVRSHWTVCRLKEWVMPLWANIYYELVFGEPCPKEAQKLICDNARDVAYALKGCSLRHMGVRNTLTQYLQKKLDSDGMPHVFPESYSLEEKALFLQGVFFNSAIVQMSDAMAHVFLALAKHDVVQQRLAASNDRQFLDKVINETLRLYPLFGIAHRIASEDIFVDENTTLPKGKVLCFDYLAYHQQGYDNPEVFNPDRWDEITKKDANFIPFGVPQNRPCPARMIALVSMRKLTRLAVEQFYFHSSVVHTRSLPSRGPCLLVRREHGMSRRLQRGILLGLRFRDRWETTYRAIIQLFFTTFMVWHARKLQLADSYFTRVDRENEASSNCPFKEKKSNVITEQNSKNI